jgi:aminocarboxymuconate-semialdehyde decarboxylase
VIIDVHAHFYPKRYLERLIEVNAGDNTAWGRAAGRTLNRNVKHDRRMFELGAHIGDMDDNGVDMEVLSLTIPYPYFDDVQSTVELTRMANDEFAELSAKYPTRFKAFAALPLPHGDAALEELNRAIDVLKLHGIGLGANVHGIPLDDERFAPIYREIHRRNLAVFMHPMLPPGVEELGEVLEVRFGALVDGALATLRLAQKGIFAENPDMNFIVPHLGSFLVGAWERLSGEGRPPRPGEPDVAGQLHRCYYDGVNQHRPTWIAAIDTFGADRIVYGTDYPFGPSERMAQAIALINSLDLTPEQKEAIFHGTAERLLR